MSLRQLRTAALVALVGSGVLRAGPPPYLEAKRTPAKDQHILGIIPNYQAVMDPTAPAEPRTVRQKWATAFRESADPFNLFNAAIGAGLSQAADSHPKYGYGPGAYGQRYGAAMADVTMQGIFTDGLMASLLHQDTRYYRLGPQANVAHRIYYSLTRVAVARTDAGKPTFNWALLGGSLLAIGFSNAYYPVRSQNGDVMLSRLNSCYTSLAVGNLLPEFWPDIKAKFFHHKR